MPEKLVRISGKDNNNKFIVAGVVVDENNIVIKSAPIFKKWMGKSLVAAYRQFKNRFDFKKVEEKVVLSQDAYKLLTEKHPIIERFVEEFELDFC